MIPPLPAARTTPARAGEASRRTTSKRAGGKRTAHERGGRPGAARGRGVVWGAVVVLALLAGCGAEGAGGDNGGGSPQAPSTSKSQSRVVEGAEKLEECPSTQSRPPVSDALPDVSLPCLGKGPDIRLADLRGPLLVNVWAQWCPPVPDRVAVPG